MRRIARSTVLPAVPVAVPLAASVALAVALAACSKPAPESAPPPRPLVVQPAPPPVEAGSALPRLDAGADGIVRMSWVESDSTGATLRFAPRDGQTWGAARTIARGEDWFVNWADFPAITALGDGTLAAHWLQKEGEDTYAYGVRVAVSPDGGATWGDPVTPHRDGVPAEHGFVSIVPLDDAFQLVWLDGRDAVGHDGGHDDEHAAAGAMTLRAALLSAAGTTAPDVLLDDRVCDCCPTDAALLPGGDVLVAYRDRSPEEVRDISVVRGHGGTWSAPARVHDDGWNIAGCPVNGPALAVHGDRVACVWFTMGRQDSARVLASFSDDGGQSFGAPVQVDTGNPLGRVDAAFGPDGVLGVVWLEDVGEYGDVRFREIAPDGPGEPLFVARVAAGRRSGLPRISAAPGGFLVAWTEPEEPSRVRAALLRRA